MDIRDFWYIACETKQLKDKKPLACKILDEWLVVFRNASGGVTALRDRCLHRGSQLSRGEVRSGTLVCPYHGWTYNGSGEVVQIPSEGPDRPRGKTRCSPPYSAVEKEGYVYVKLKPQKQDQEQPLGPPEPFSIPFYGAAGWHKIRLKNRFKNSVTNCVENFVDVPHTVFVHPGIFRKTQGRKLTATVSRQNGEVHVEYNNEVNSFGWFSKFFGLKQKSIKHTDSYFMPNVTSVEYNMGPKRIFYITSQSIPIAEEETLVYTDLTYNYGLWNKLVAPLVRIHAQKIISQDIDVLNNQMKTIKKYGMNFQNSPADIIHVFIESIRKKLEEGADPRRLPAKKATVDFWI